MAPTQKLAVKLKYTNRKSEGIRLAVVVAKDITKHRIAFEKKADHADGDSASLELDLESKKQDDLSVRAFCASLTGAISVRNGIAPLRLEELNLRDNSLTTSSLELLAPVISAARFDLRELDLSDNKISVTTIEEAAQWEFFLRSFAGCVVMRRLALSGNDLSGSLAMEVFLRVYCDQASVDPSLFVHESDGSDMDNSIVDLVERSTNVSLSPRNRADSVNSDGSGPSISATMTQGQVMKRRKGLRAIPYIILRNVQLEDGGALHLSHILESHFWPQYLCTKLKEGSREAKRRQEDDVEGSFGLVYAGNTKLSTYGSRLLDVANDARSELVGQPMAARSLQSSWIDAIKIPKSPSQMRKMSLSSRMSIEEADRRITHGSTSIENLRMRIERTTLDSFGVKTTQLWLAAVKILFLARVILPQEGPDMLTKTRIVSNLPITAAPPGEPELAVNGGPRTARKPVISALGQQLKAYGRGMTDQTKRSAPISVGKEFAADTRNPRRLPTELWVRIFMEAADANGIINEDQLAKIIGYSRDRSNLTAEASLISKGRSHQIWHVLDMLDCFTYELKMAVD